MLVVSDEMGENSGGLVCLVESYLTTRTSSSKGRRIVLPFYGYRRMTRRPPRIQKEVIYARIIAIGMTNKEIEENHEDR